MERSINSLRLVTIFALRVTLSFQDEFSRRSSVVRLKLVHVIIPQTRQDEFVQQFLIAFRKTDWSTHASGDDWPPSGVS